MEEVKSVFIDKYVERLTHKVRQELTLRLPSFLKFNGEKSEEKLFLMESVNRANEIVKEIVK